MVRRFVFPALLVVYSCAVLAQDAPAVTSDQRLWVAPKSESDSRRAELHVRFTPQHTLPGTVTFECEVTSPEPLDETHLVLTVENPVGNPIHTGEARLDLAKGTAPTAFTWTPEGLADGEYTAHFDLHRQSGGALADVRLGLTLLTGSLLHSRIDGTRAEAETLRHTLDALGGAGTRPAYALLHTAIIEDYLPLASAALNSGDWRKADEFAVYLGELAKTARLELSLVSPSTASTWEPGAGRGGKVDIRDGSFVSGGGRVFLFGAASVGSPLRVLWALERYGLDLSVYRVAPADTLADASATTGFAAPMAAYLDDAQRRGVQVIVDLAPEALPGWAQSPAVETADGGTFGYDLMAGTSRTVLERHVAAVAAAANGHANVLAVSLARDPGLRLRDSALREGLMALAKSRYGEYDRMNRRWRTRYMGFDEIEVDWASRHAAYLYDLLTYHQELGTQLFGWLAGLSRQGAPDVPVQVQFADTAFEKGESARGIDRESVLATMDIAGCSPSQSLDGTGLALGTPRQAACYALLRSLRPSAPVVNSNDRFALPAGITGQAAYGRVRAMMWEAVMAGLDASVVQLGVPGQGNEGILARPEPVDAYATARLDINRLAPIVAALQEAPAPVRILWSPSSAMFAKGEPYLESALRAYEGCANFGPHTLFISERECERTGLDGAKVLVIPKALALSDGAFHAIDRFIEGGGVTVRQGNPFPYDQQGVSRTDTVSVSKRTVLMRSEDTARAYLDALDAAYALDGMESPPRPVNEFDYPIDGVKSRFAVHERVPYLYLINLRNGPVRVKLFGPYTSGTDLVSGERIAFPEAIDPLTPMIIQLDAPAVTEKIASNTDNQPAQPVELKPVVDEAAAKKAPAYPAMRHGR